MTTRSLFPELAHLLIPDQYLVDQHHRGSYFCLICLICDILEITNAGKYCVNLHSDNLSQYRYFAIVK